MDLTEQDIPNLLGKLAGEVSKLAQDEVALAKLELRKNVREGLFDVAAIGAGGSIIYAGFLFLLLGVASALTMAVPFWGACLIVGTVVTLLGALAMRMGLKRVSSEALQFNHTAQTLETNSNFLKEQVVNDE